ncbi:MAG: hypothetical protein JWP91_2470 [Fibrobacteres bacterium]|nr:hypothetical protein [Fibrobacterota bacterium]
MSKLKNLPRSLLAFLLVSGSVTAARTQSTQVDFQGKVVDQKGAALAGASVKLLETALVATTDAQGRFSLKGSVAIGLIHRTRLPGNLELRFRDGILSLDGTESGWMKMEWISPDGSRKVLPQGEGKSDRTRSWNLEKMAGGRGGSGLHWLRITTSSGSASFRFISQGTHGTLWGGPGYAGIAGGGPGAAAALSKVGGRVAAGSQAVSGFVLEAAADGFLAKRFPQSDSVKAGLSLALLPAVATLKERIQDFIGAGNTFRLAFVKPEAVGSRKFILHYADFAEMTGDTLPMHAFPDSRGPASSPYGAFAPSWSPDGRAIAYETGWENLTTPISRIYLQPIGGARADGPAYPATNPRWWTDGKDTSLVWCSSGREDAWADTSSATYRQRISGGALTGTPEILSKGSFNAGLSPDGKYLATAYRFALMMDRASQGKRYLHVYPGHPKAADGANTDSLQACNGSVSRDPAHPSRMLFLDFGVPEEPSYANAVEPKVYAQHRMILIGDYASDAPGRIVDFIDSPAAELAKEKTWDDPEWTNLPGFAVATTRDPEGDKSVPTEPKPSQPDIYLINLVTKESLKVFSGPNQLLPAAWIGPAD